MKLWAANEKDPSVWRDLDTSDETIVGSRGSIQILGSNIVLVVGAGRKERKKKGGGGLRLRALVALRRRVQ